MVPANVAVTDYPVKPSGRRPPSVFTSTARRPPSIVDDLQRADSGSADPDLVDAQRAAEILAMSAERLDDLVRTHRITYYERGSVVLFDPEDLAAWRRKEPTQYRPRRSRLGR